MKVTCHGPKEGRLWSISISGEIGRRGIVSVLRCLDGVLITKDPGAFSAMHDEPFCEFDLKGQKFIIEAEWPAFNSFEISPKPRGSKNQMVEIKDFLEGFEEP